MKQRILLLLLVLFSYSMNAQTENNCDCRLIPYHPSCYNYCLAKMKIKRVMEQFKKQTPIDDSKTKKILKLYADTTLNPGQKYDSLKQLFTYNEFIKFKEYLGLLNKTEIAYLNADPLIENEIPGKKNNIVIAMLDDTLKEKSAKARFLFKETFADILQGRYFNILNDEKINKIVREMSIRIEQGVVSTNIVEQGKTISADYFVFTKITALKVDSIEEGPNSVIDINKNKSKKYFCFIDLQVQLIQTSTGNIIFSSVISNSNYTKEKSYFLAIQEALQQLVNKTFAILLKNIPADLHITEVSNLDVNNSISEVKINAGSNLGLTKDMLLELRNSKSKNESDNNLPIGLMKIISVNNEFSSTCQVLEGNNEITRLFNNGNSMIITPQFALITKDKKPHKLIIPTIMVVPYVKANENIRDIIEADVNKRIAVKCVEEEFNKRGALTTNFEATAKLVGESNNKITGENLMEEVIQLSGVDIIVEVEPIVNKGKDGTSALLTLTAYDTYTNASLANKVITGNAFKTDNIQSLIAITVERKTDDFLNALQTSFNDELENGFAIIIHIKTDEHSSLNMESKVDNGRITLADLIDEWLALNTINSRYSISDLTESMMRIEDVRIPVRSKHGSKNSASKFAFELCEFLNKYGINTGREIYKNKVTIKIK